MIETKKSKNIDESGISKEYMTIFWPTLLMASALMLSNVLNGIIVGNLLGSDNLAAINLAFPIIQLFSIIYFIFGVGGSSLVSYFQGKKNEKEANRFFSITLIGMVLIGLTISIIGTLFIDQLSSFLSRGNIDLFPLVKTYLFPIILISPLPIFISGILYFIRTDSMPRLASISIISSNIVNLGLNFILIKFFNFDILAGGISYGVGFVVAAIILLFYYFSKKRSLRFTFPDRFVFKSTCDIMKAGFSPGLSSALMFFKILIINQILLFSSGKTAVIAFSICQATLALGSMFISGSTQTMIPLVSRFLGEKNKEGVKFVFRKTAIILGISIVGLVTFVVIFPQFIAQCFGIVNPVELSLTQTALRIFAPSLLGVAFAYLIMYFTQVIRKHTISIFISILEGFIVIVPLAFILAMFLSDTGVWIAFIVGEAISSFIIVLLFPKIFKFDFPNK